MLLKDCPVGSWVELESYDGDKDYANTHEWWKGKFIVKQLSSGEHYVVDNDEETRDDIENKEYFQFKIVSHPDTANNNTLTLDGKTYTITPLKLRKQITIDGIIYEIEEQT